MSLLRLKKKIDVDNKVIILFSVKDTGIGLRDEEIKKLFDSFSQADSSTTRRYGGTGLGLAICKSIVKMMSGTIHVSSNYGKGSVFSFTAEFDKSDKQLVRNQAQTSFTNLDVLIVDDNPDLCEVLSNYLIELGCHIAVANSGEEALELLDKRVKLGKKPWQFILVDWIMEGMDGFKFIHLYNEQVTGKESKNCSYDQL